MVVGRASWYAQRNGNRLEAQPGRAVDGAGAVDARLWADLPFSAALREGAGHDDRRQPGILGGHGLLRAGLHHDDRVANLGIDCRPQWPQAHAGARHARRRSDRCGHGLCPERRATGVSPCATGRHDRRDCGKQRAGGIADSARTDGLCAGRHQYGALGWRCRRPPRSQRAEPSSITSTTASEPSR